MDNLNYLFIVDSYKWALHKRAINLNKYLNLNAEIIHFNEINKINLNKFNVVYSLNWPIYGYIQNKISNKKFKLLTTISSHEKNRPILIKNILNKHDNFSVSNIHLLNEYLLHYKKVYYTPFGVDHNIYKQYTDPNNYKNIFGFVGNISRVEKRFKVIENIINNIPNAKLITATNLDLFNDHQMIEFYNNIGTLICFSTSEGTPNPILEAAACGRNIITTNVGNVSELFLNNLKNNIVDSEFSLKNNILNIINKNIDLSLSGNSLKENILNNWTWEKKSENFKKFLSI